MATSGAVRRWTFSDEAVTVECARAVLDELGRAVTEASTRFPHGGFEIGGVLFGMVSGETIRIAAARPLEIEYGRGACFLLTEADESALEQLKCSVAADQALRGHEVVGWYASHTRRELVLTEADLQFYTQHFGRPGQVSMLIRPERLTIIGTAVSVRMPDGRLVAASAWRDVSAVEEDRVDAASVETLACAVAEGAAEEAPPIISVNTEGPQEVEAPKFEISQAQRVRPRLTAWIPAAGTVAVALVGVFFWMHPEPPPTPARATATGARATEGAASRTPDAPSPGPRANTIAQQPANVEMAVTQRSAKPVRRSKRHNRRKTRRAKAHPTRASATR